MKVESKSHSQQSYSSKIAPARMSRMWKLVGIVALVHVVVILALSPRLYWADETSPDALYAKGEKAMNEGRHLEAMEYFRKVMDQQPKPPPVYLKAAEQHRLADRLVREAEGKSAQKTVAPNPGPATAPVQAAPPATRPTADPEPARGKPFIPPELNSGK